ncbi:MAG: GAF and ANTAR domain-containing protein [Agrococcus sp.]
MSELSKEARLNAAFIALAEKLTSEYDVVELLHSLMAECDGLLDVQAAALLLKNARGELELVASTSEAAGFLEVMQLNAGGGPCIECASTGELVSVVDIRATGEHWREFREAALLEGFHSAHAVPLRVRSDVIGSLGLFRARSGPLDPAEEAIARALADVASIGILQERILRESAVVAEQLQRALDSRVLIEQAKGVLAALHDVDVDEAFRMLCAHARANNLKLHATARGVVDRTERIARGPGGVVSEAVR